jgi:ATP-binding cassette subfamily F protein 3
MLRIKNISFRIGGRTLFEDASAHVPAGHRVGMVGANGSGKTTLLRLISGRGELDGGEIEVRSRMRVGMVAQEAPDGGLTPLEATLAADRELADLEAEAVVASDPSRIAEIQERLDAIDAHSAPARAATILSGLGFSEAAQHRPLSSFSGGWQMRVALAEVLFTEPDLLLLDEPTNHLDIEAAMWLENHLKTYPNTLLLVSHDRRLLSNSVDSILHLYGRRLEMYSGGYDDFIRVRLARLAHNEAIAEKQAAERARMEAFVNRFRAKATKARQAQSRLKMLERMAPVAAVPTERKVAFRFPEPGPCSSPLVRLDGAAVGYRKDAPVLSGIGCSIYDSDRVALLGANGNGKTTLARLIAGELAPMDGAVVRAGKLRVGYFAQNHLDRLDPRRSPIEQLRLVMEEAPVKDIRAWLGRFSLGEDKAEVPIAQLSGGEKTRLALSLAVRDRPNLLVLDEPTNHLDIDSRQSLIEALADYRGAVVLVSHDRHLVEASADQLWLVQDGRVEAFFGDLDDYYNAVAGASRSARQRDAESRNDTSPKPDRREQRRDAARRRARLAPLRTAVAEAEAALEALHGEKEALEQSLADPATYEGDSSKVAGLTRRRGELEAAVGEAEERWLEAQAELEEASAACDDE